MLARKPRGEGQPERAAADDGKFHDEKRRRISSACLNPSDA
jgi:hypothetical protein